jgi:hypothetical protein
MGRSPGCHAYQESDQMVCPLCALRWDVNDPEPPNCRCSPAVGGGGGAEFITAGGPRGGGGGAFFAAVDAILVKKLTAPDLLDAAAATFRERNAVYGNNYQRMGALLLALFPEGGVPPVTTEADANRLNLMIDCLGKLQRYAHNFARGGHRDSAHDLCVYAAMLEEATQ